MWYSKKTEPGSSEGKAQQGRKQDMIKQSIRIFCVEEIYDMVRKKEYSKDFLEYVKSAPNNIKEWLRKIGVDESLPEMRYIAEPEVHNTEEPEVRSDSDLYSGMRFGDKIQVERLVLHEMTGTKCSIHFKPYQRIKVVCSIGVKTFSIRTYCCPKCCKLYMKTGNFKGIQPILKNRNVNYVWIAADEVAK